MSLKLRRRQFLQAGLATGVGLFAPAHWQIARRALAQMSSTLDPTSIPKFVEPLIIPPVMQPADQQDGDGAVRYEIAARQFEQQVLPTGMPKTTVWGYGKTGDVASFHFPAFTVETRTEQTVRVVWANQLVDDPDGDSPQYLPHLLPVDTAMHWANPPGAMEMHGATSERYYGPVPIVTHTHGAHIQPQSDGFPAAWWLPAAANIPEGYRTQGSHYATTQEAAPGTAVFEYPNGQRATTLWYHDHALGITRLNVYAGLAGFWIIRDDVEDALNLPGPAPRLGDPPDTKYYEIPIVIQDRSFNEDGSLFYPDSRVFFDEYAGPYYPETPVPSIWNPEFFGNAIVVNGRTWPYLDVEPRLYRLRLINGTNSRFLVLKFDKALPFHQIGTEGGLLPDQPVVLDQLLMGPAERADVIVDFSSFAPGDEIILLNIGPDEPFGGFPIDPEVLANPDTTGQVLLFKVVELTDHGNPGEIPASLPPIERLTTDLPERQLTLNEEVYEAADIPFEAELGTAAKGVLSWDEEITESPKVNSVEIWMLANLTEDAHPIHVHLVMFQVVERVPFDAEAYHETQQEFLKGDKTGAPPDPNDFVNGDPRGPEPWEMGWKDTVIAYPGELTRIISRFDVAGLYVWHCHILEHEDNEMMRPYEVLAE
jgi:FtsP/CotA-like multicopper oxidase with cupredoxin domain